MAAILPIKTRILEWCIENDRPVSSAEVAAVLEKEYPGEYTAKPQSIEKQMDLYCKLGFMKPVDIKDNEGEMEVIYQVTASGKSEIKYIPGHGNKLF